MAEGEFYAIQTASVPNVPRWAARVGQAYQVTATAHAPALSQASVTIGYLSRDVPDGAESALDLYYLEGSNWLPLDTQRNEAANLLSAPLRGPGLYAIFAAITLPSFEGVGWHQFAYPIGGTRPISAALSSIGGKYTLVYRDSSGQLGARWQLYAPGAPDYINTLAQLSFAETYAIYVSEPTTTTIRLRPAIAATTMAVPATIYGNLGAATGFSPHVTITARVGEVVCGLTRTIQLVESGEVVFSIQVEADSIATVAGCGAAGRSVQLFYGAQTLGGPVVWDNTRLTVFGQLANAPETWVYLPMVQP